MAGPSWLAGAFAAVMILIAAYSAARLLFARRHRRATEIDADALHVVMGTAMAGMLVPRLNVLPPGVWAAVFVIGAAWFGWHAIRRRGPGAPGASQCRYPVPHLIECAAMIYMLLPAAVPRRAHAGPSMAMPGMSAGPAADFPALAVVLALSMIGYIIWTTDRLATLARAKTTTASPRFIRDCPLTGTAATAPARPSPAAPSSTGTRHSNPAAQAMLAPKLAACCKIAMSLAMGYMLILML
jgi:Domain of unknown function (DUF5134)